MAERHAINELSGLKIKSFLIIIISLAPLQLNITSLSVFCIKTLCYFIKIAAKGHASVNDKKSNARVDQQTVTFCLRLFECAKGTSLYKA